MSRKIPLNNKSRNKETKDVNNNNHEGYISFSFRYFQNHDNNPVQSLNDWEKESRLLDMITSLEYCSKNHIAKLKIDKKLVLYGKFPDQNVNDFSLPNGLSEIENWGTLRNIGGQKIRIAGFLKDSVFYIVYLDKEHRFYKSKNQ